MRVSRALPTLMIFLPSATILACGSADDGGSASSSSQTSSTPATTDLATTTTDSTASTPTTTTSTTDAPATDTTPTTDAASTTSSVTSEPGDTTATTAPVSTTATTGPADTTDTADTGTTHDTDASDTGTGTDTTGTTGPTCPEGQDGCACAPAQTCDPGLACTQGLCGPAPTCGDGQQDPGEQCDDGPNNGDGNACKLDCSEQVCGDGDVGPGEQCDDGNQLDGDGCQKNCLLTPVQPKDACGFDSDGVWFQIDYENAFTVSSPSYTYSPTPGWGEAQWAPTGKDWPYAVDLFNNASVTNDQIGKVALLNGTNKAVRVYFGLTGLNYTYATVCVEGRSYSVGSPVTFLVQEAKTKCGDYGMMANDWTVHATGVDLQDCFLPGDPFQAVQVQPSSGSGALSLKRLRVTLHGATY